MGAQFCTFRLDDLYLGVKVDQVQEVIRYQEMTRVPRAPAEVRGLINLRGQIVTAVDLGTRLGLKRKRQVEKPMNVIVTTEENAVSLLVDEIGDVVEVDDEAWERPPRTLPANLREVVSGIYKLEGELLLILDPGVVTSVGV